MSIFSRKHYKVIADLFAANSKYSGYPDRVWWVAFADLFEMDNPRFKRLLFLQKCQEGG